MVLLEFTTVIQNFKNKTIRHGLRYLLLLILMSAGVYQLSRMNLTWPKASGSSYFLFLVFAGALAAHIVQSCMTKEIVYWNGKDLYWSEALA